MLRNKVKTLVAIILTITVVMMATKSLAVNDYTCNIQLSGNKRQLKRGESIIILVKATDIQAGDGIAAYSTALEYNNEVFDCKVTGDDNEVWTKISLIENVLSMNRTDMVANSEDQIITKIILTTKQDAPIGSYTFKLTQISFTAGDETFSINDVSATIPIVNDDIGETPGGSQGETPGGSQGETPGGSQGETPGGSQGETPGGSQGETPGGSQGETPGGSQEEAPGETEGEDEKNNDKYKPTPNNSADKEYSNNKQPSSIAKPSSADDTLPKTGIADWLIGGILLGIITSIIFYIKYKRAYQE